MKSLRYLFVALILCAILQVEAMDGIIEIRTYNLKPGSRDTFHKLVKEQAVPLLNKWHIKVISFGPSLLDENTYYLIRSYQDLHHLNSSEEAFYGSSEWVSGPREAILSLIINYTTLVISGGTFEYNLSSDEDLKTLSKLNAQFIKNFINQDTLAHNEIIHKDFVCIESSGVILNRKEYMRDWSHDYGDANFKSFYYTDEFIRVFGNMALVRSRTQYTKLEEGKELTGGSIYTDTYIKENGRWWCVQAQITGLKKTYK